MIELQRCEQCGLERSPGAASCPRCGLVFQTASSGRLTLVLRVAEAMDGVQQWLVSKDEAVIGRSHACDVVLSHDSVSRQHARVRRTPVGFQIEDLGSQNWTFVNDARLTAPRALADGDQVVIGKVPLSVAFIEAPPELAAPDPSLAPMPTIMVDVSDALAEAPAPPAADEPTTEEIAGRGRQPLEAPPSAPRAPTIEVAGAEALEQLAQKLRAARALVDQAGGRQALLELLEHARQTAADSSDVHQLMELGQRAHAAVALLEAELALIDALWPSATADQELQTD